jgi:RHS repeat-associated protein
VASAFGGVSGGGGESGSIFNGVNNAISTFGMSGNQGSNRPSAYLNYIIFDQQYKVINMGWTAVPTSANFAKQKITVNAPQIKEPGFVFVYLSYENAGTTLVNFDDVKVTHTRNNIIQYNEYYAFQHTTGNSWTREQVTGNNFLANGGTELNTTTQLYDLDFRNYDPLLGRMNGVDPMASKYSSLTPYNFSYNNPTNHTDPSGADPGGGGVWFQTGSVQYPGYTYDDKEIPIQREYICAMCWRDGDGMSRYGRLTGYGTGGMGAGWSPSGNSFFAGFNSWVDGRISQRNMLRGIAEALGTESGGSVDTRTGAVNKFTLFERTYETVTGAGVTDSEFLGYVLRDESGAMVWTNVRTAKFFVSIEEFFAPDFTSQYLDKDNRPRGGNAGFMDDEDIKVDKQLIYGYYEDTGFELEYDNTTRGFPWMKLEVNTSRKNGFDYIIGKNGRTTFSIAYKQTSAKHEFHVSQHSGIGIPFWYSTASRVMASSNFSFNPKTDAIIGVRQQGVRSNYDFTILSGFGPTGVGHVRTNLNPLK